MTLNSFSTLPVEITAQIFSFIDIQCLFKSCSAVCSRWHDFLESETFWRQLLDWEFGRNRTSMFLQIKGYSVEKIKNSLHSDKIFNRHCLLGKLPQVTLTRSWIPSNTDFASALQSSLEIANAVNVPYYFVESEWCLANLAVFLSDFHRDLVCKLGFALVWTEPRGLTWRKQSIVFLNERYEIVSELPCPTGNDDNWIVIDEIPSGSAFVAKQSNDHFGAAIRLTFPSHAKRLKQFNKLMTAIRRSRTDKLKDVLQHDASVVKWYDTKNRTPLMVATIFASCSLTTDFEMIRLLLDAGADINQPSARDISSRVTIPLGAAISSNNFQLTKFMLDNGSNVSYVDDCQCSLLGHALFDTWNFGHLALSELLISQGADINSMYAVDDECPEKLLIVAILRCQVDIVELLVDRGANISEASAVSGKKSLELAMNCRNDAFDADRKAQYEAITRILLSKLSNTSDSNANT